MVTGIPLNGSRLSIGQPSHTTVVKGMPRSGSRLVIGLPLQVREVRGIPRNGSRLWIRLLGQFRAINGRPRIGLRSSIPQFSITRMNPSFVARRSNGAPGHARESFPRHSSIS